MDQLVEEYGKMFGISEAYASTVVLNDQLLIEHQDTFKLEDLIEFTRRFPAAMVNGHGMDELVIRSSRQEMAEWAISNQKASPPAIEIYRLATMATHDENI